MKRSGFKKLTYAEAIAKQDAARKRAAERAKAKREEKKQRREKGLQPVKKDRVKTLKRKLWVTFSKYIRKSHADKNGMVRPCDYDGNDPTQEYVPWQQTDCGHLFSNSERNQSLGGNELWYYEKNFAPQNSQGNRFGSKDSAKMYMLWAVKRYGQAEVDKMFRMKHTPRQFTEDELQALCEHYQQLFDKL